MTRRVTALAITARPTDGVGPRREKTRPAASSPDQGYWQRVYGRTLTCSGNYTRF